MKRVKKVWGYELEIANNKLYCCKILGVKRQFRCSYHKHEIKDETFYVQKGIVLMKHKGKEFFMNHKSPPLRILPGEYHSFMAMSGNVEIIESSTQHFDEDSYRKNKSHFVKIDDFEMYTDLMYRNSTMWRR